MGVDWKTHRDILWHNLQEATRATFELEQFAKSTLHDNSSETDRLQQLFFTVCQRVQQRGAFGNFLDPATNILARGEGNRVVLLVALLKVMKYQPKLLLVRPTANSQKEYLFPNSRIYTYPLIGVKTENQKTLWMDPTNQYNPPGVIYPFLQNMKALDVTSPKNTDPFSQAPTSQKKPLQKSILLQLFLDKNGDLKGSGTETITTSQAANYRQLLNSLSPARQKKVMEAGLGKYFSGAMLSKVKIEALEDPDKPLVLKYQMQVPGFACRLEDTLVIQGGFYPYRLAASLISKEVRKSPLLLGDETNTRTRVELHFPKGTMLSKKVDLSLQAPLSNFNYRVTTGKNSLVIEKSLQVKSGRVTPSKYPKFREFCLKVDQQDVGEFIYRLEP